MLGTELLVYPLYFGMFGRNPRLPLDVCFPSQKFKNPIAGQSIWKICQVGLIHEHMHKNELLAIPMDQGIKSPRGIDSIKLGDLVYQFSPGTIVNLSRKLTLRWQGPYRVVEIISPSLCIIFPIGDWCVQKKKLEHLHQG